jgi:hypothetical protein
MINMNKLVKCVICHKDLRIEHDGEIVYDGGKLELLVGYGSKFDQICVGRTTPLTPVEKLPKCRIINAYICDDCIEAIWL